MRPAGPYAQCDLCCRAALSVCHVRVVWNLETAKHIPKLYHFLVAPLFQIFRKSKGKGLDTCYSATYMSPTRDQQRFTISEVAADWQEPMVPQRIMWPSIARPNGQLNPRCS